MSTKKKSTKSAPKKPVNDTPAAIDRLSLALVQAANVVANGFESLGSKLQYAIMSSDATMRRMLDAQREAISADMRALLLPLQISASEPKTGKFSSYSVALYAVGPQKIQVIKAIREVTNLGLKEAKDLTDVVPSVVLKEVDQTKATAAAALLRNAGARVEVHGVAIVEAMMAPIAQGASGASPPAPQEVAPVRYAGNAACCASCGMALAVGGCGIQREPVDGACAYHKESLASLKAKDSMEG